MDREKERVRVCVRDTHTHTHTHTHRKREKRERETETERSRQRDKKTNRQIMTEREIENAARSSQNAPFAYLRCPKLYLLSLEFVTFQSDIQVDFLNSKLYLQFTQ